MPNITQSMQNLRWIDDQSEKETCIHSINPTVKLIVVLIFILLLVSFDNYSFTRIMPLIIYMVVISQLAEVSLLHIIKLSLLSFPLIIGIGIFNPFFNRETAFYIAEIPISFGVISFATLVLKSLLSVTAGLLLIATTGINRIAAALRTLHAPKIFVIQLLLTYRYITVLMEEVNKTLTARALRANQNKKLDYKSFGHITGNILLQTINRSSRIYYAMKLRGFSGDFKSGDRENITLSDMIYLAAWTLFFAFVRTTNIYEVFGSIL